MGLNNSKEMKFFPPLSSVLSRRVPKMHLQFSLLHRGNSRALPRREPRTRADQPDVPRRMLTRILRPATHVRIAMDNS